MDKKLISIAAVSLIAATGYSGTGDGIANARGSNDSSALALPSVRQPHNGQDVTFAQLMIQHHRQAVEMSEHAARQAGKPEIRQLAQQIQAAQEPQIQAMTGWLRQWGAQIPAEEPGEMNGEMHGGPSGMMTEEEMARLSKASGAQFDKMFLTMMIKLHEGAVTMAKKEQAKGAFPPAKTMAGEIITTQNAEIAKMRQLLGRP